MISELNDKVARFDSRLLAEKNATRKVEREKERLEEELKLARENLEKVLKKGEQLVRPLIFNVQCPDRFISTNGLHELHFYS